MADSEPPTYGAPPAALFPLLLNITPLHNAISFQTGEFGAYLEGVVEFKTDNSEGATTQPPLEKLQVMFRGIEKRGEEETVLYETSLDLWGNRVPSTSALPGDSPPASIPFKIPLTPDLPHCIHLAHSSLLYSISATLFYSHTLPPLSRIVPIHLVRLSPSAPATATTPAQIESVDDPVSISVRLPKGVFRRREAIPIYIKIEVPPSSIGLRLRNVNAELLRKIVVGGTNASPTKPIGTEEIQEVVSPPRPPEEPHLTVLARSGKTCRFSPSRPIIMRLLLHPPSTDTSCESISQSSIFHEVSFFVKTTISLFSIDPTTPVSSPVITHSIQIVPDSPCTPPTIRSEKEREVEQEEIPSYHESAGESSSSHNAVPGRAASGSSVPHEKEPQLEEEEEEFDGYESFSTDLVMPPPPIEEDVSPPTVEELSSDPPAVPLHPAVESFPPLSSPPEFPSAIEAQPLRLHELVGLIDLATTDPRISPPSTPSSLASVTPVAYSLAASDDQTPPPYFGDSLPVNRPVLASTSGPPPYSDSNLRS